VTDSRLFFPGFYPLGFMFCVVIVARCVPIVCALQASQDTTIVFSDICKRIAVQLAEEESRLEQQVQVRFSVWL